MKKMMIIFLSILSVAFCSVAMDDEARKKQSEKVLECIIKNITPPHSPQKTGLLSIDTKPFGLDDFKPTSPEKLEEDDTVLYGSDTE